MRKSPQICAFRAVTEYMVGWDLTKGHPSPVVSADGGWREGALSAPRMTPSSLRSHVRAAAELPRSFTMRSFRVGGSLSQPLEGHGGGNHAHRRLKGPSRSQSLHQGHQEESNNTNIRKVGRGGSRNPTITSDDPREEDDTKKCSTRWPHATLWETVKTIQEARRLCNHD